MWAAAERILSAGLPVIGGLLGAAGTRAANSAAAAEAQRNRDFQERMSSTAHQREVADLIKAGLNPILSAHRGASSPGGAVADVKDVGEGAARGISSALAIRQLRSQINLMDAQTAQANAQAQESNVRAGDILNTAKAGRLESITLSRDLLQLDKTQRERLLPLVLERAKAEIEQTMSSAQAMQARAALDNLSRAGAENIAEFERQFGSTPAVRLFLELLRSLR